jgi:hypothetical protein
MSVSTRKMSGILSLDGIFLKMIANGLAAKESWRF